MMYNVLSKKKAIQLLGVGVLAFSLAACNEENSSEKTSDQKTEQSSQAKSTTRVVTDAIGHKVEIPANPKRVIASYLEDNLVALGITPVAQWSVGDGASIQDYLQDKLGKVPTISYDLPFESVQKLKPDLIIMDSAQMVEGNKYEQYSKIAPTYVIGKEQNNDWRDELLRVGDVFDKKDQAQEILDKYDEKVTKAKTEINDAVGTPSVAAVWLFGGKFYMVNEKLSTGAVLYQDLGLKVPAVVKEISAKSTSNWNEISLEKLVELDADHIFLVNGDAQKAKSTLSNKLWQSIPAVKAGNVHEFSSKESWLYTGPIANEQIVDNVVKSLAK